MIMRYFSSLFAASLLTVATSFAQNFSVINTMCGNRVDPEGIGTLAPSFSWNVRSLDRGFMQSAYEITVGTDSSALAAGYGSMWREKVKSSGSLNIVYGGKALGSGCKYYWKVRVFNESGKASRWSAVSSFSTGLMSDSDWSGARWIACEVEPDSLRIVPGQEFNKLKIGDRITGTNKLPQFRKEFVSSGNVKRAVAYVSGLGQFEFYLNGKKVGDHFLDPVWSDYDKIIGYVTFDVTDMIRDGANVLGVMLGNGMYNIPRERYYKLLMSYGYPMMRLKLDVETEDGVHNVTVSDASWKTAESPVTYSSIFGGEDYDATKELGGWMLPGYDDGDWDNVCMAGIAGEMRAPEADPVKVMQEFPVMRRWKTKYGAWLYDLGQNFSGIPQITVKGERGRTVTMNTCELFDRKVDSIQVHAGYRGETRFSYTLRGDSEPETWYPRFTYHGFRYVLVKGAVPEGEDNPEGLPEIIDLKGLHIRNSARGTGSFTCSSPLLDRTEEMIDWAIRSNMVSYLTDCPHREKLPWLEQLNLMFGSLQYKYDFRNLYRKMMDDMDYAQLPGGLVPDIAPEYAVFLGGFRDSPEWGSSIILVPQYMLDYYGDDSMIAPHWDAMERYMEHLASLSGGHILSHGLGDWCDIGPKMPGVSQLTSIAATATPVYYMDAVAMSGFAARLGLPEKEARYRALADSIKAAYNAAYFHEEGCYYDRNSQCANAIALCAGLVDEQYRKGVEDNIVKDIRERGNAVSAGDVGYNYVLRALEAAGRSDVIWDMNSRYDKFGYGYMLARGATALPESWQALSQKSHNHLMLGHLLEWFYSHVGGIRRDPSAAAFRKSVIAPVPVGTLNSADVKFDSPYGRIRSEWEKSGGRFSLRVEIPANTTSTICVPASSDATVLEGGVPVVSGGESVHCPAGLECLGWSDGCWRFGVVSGTWSFEVR